MEKWGKGRDKRENGIRGKGNREKKEEGKKGKKGGKGKGKKGEKGKMGGKEIGKNATGKMDKW